MTRRAHASDEGEALFPGEALTAIGTYRATFSYVGLERQLSFEISPAPPAKVELVEALAPTMEAGRFFALYFRALDAFGNLARGYQVALSVSLSAENSSVPLYYENASVVTLCTIQGCELSSSTGHFAMEGLYVDSSAANVEIVIEWASAAASAGRVAPAPRVDVISVRPSFLVVSDAALESVAGQALGPIELTVKDYASQDFSLVLVGAAQSASGASIQLAPDTDPTTGLLVGRYVEVYAGAGAGQLALITAYDGPSRTASADFTEAPAAGSLYRVLFAVRLAAVRAADAPAGGLQAGQELALPANLTVYSGADVPALTGERIRLLRAPSAVVTFSDVVLYSAGVYQLVFAIAGMDDRGTTGQITVRGAGVFRVHIETSSVPASTVAGTALAVSGEAYDEHGNLAHGAADLTGSFAGSLASRVDCCGIVQHATASEAFPALVASVQDGLFDVSFTPEVAGNFSLTLAHAASGASDTTPVFAVAPTAATVLELLGRPRSFTVNTVSKGLLPEQPYRGIVTDVYGNIVRGAGITAQLVGDLCSFSGVDCVARLSGTREARRHSSDFLRFTDLAVAAAAEGYAIRFTATGAAASSSLELTTAAFDVTAGQAHHIYVRPESECPELGAGDCGTVGEPILATPEVVVVDVVDNPVPTTIYVGVSIPAGLGGYPGLVQGTTIKLAENGFARFEGLRIDMTPKGALGFTFQFDALAVGGFTGAVEPGFSLNFRLLPGPSVAIGLAAQIANNSEWYIFTPIGGEAGAATVESRDAFGNLAADNTDAIYASLEDPTDSGGLLGGTTVLNLDGGRATFTDLFVNRPGGSLSLRFCRLSGFTCPQKAVTDTFSVIPIGALVLQTQPRDSSAGNVLSPAPVVRVVDPEGNLIDSDVPVSVRLEPQLAPGAPAVTDGALVGITTVASIDGIATFAHIAVQKRGTFKLVFLVGQHNAGVEVESDEFVVGPSEASRLCLTPDVCQIIIDKSPDATGTVAGDEFEVKVHILDEFSNPVEPGGNISLEVLFNSSFALPTNDTFARLGEGGRASFAVYIKKSCDDVFCHDLPFQGYVLRFTIGVVSDVSPLFAVWPQIPASFVALFEGTDAQAGKSAEFQSAVKLLDVFGNLAWRDEQVWVYVAEYLGPGCLICSNNGAFPGLLPLGFTLYGSNSQGDWFVEANGSVFPWQADQYGHYIAGAEAVEDLASIVSWTDGGGCSGAEVTEPVSSKSVCSDVAVSNQGLINMELLSAPAVVGEATFNVSLRAWNFKDNRLFEHPIQVSFRVIPSDAHSVVITEEADLTGVAAGAPLSFQAIVYDAFGNPLVDGCLAPSLVDAGNKELRVLAQCSSCTGPVPLTDGGATVVISATRATYGTSAFPELVSVVLSYAHADGGSCVDSEPAQGTEAVFASTPPFQVAPGALAMLEAASPPAEAPADSSVLLEILALDSLGNLVAASPLDGGTTVTLRAADPAYPGCFRCGCALEDGDAPCECDAACQVPGATFADGVVRLVATVPTAATEGMRLNVTIVRGALALTATTPPLAVVAGPAASGQVVSAPARAVLGELFTESVLVRVLDALGNPCPGQVVHAALQGCPGFAITGSANRTDTNASGLSTLANLTVEGDLLASPPSYCELRVSAGSAAASTSLELVTFDPAAYPDLAASAFQAASVTHVDGAAPGSTSTTLKAGQSFDTALTVSAGASAIGSYKITVALEDVATRELLPLGGVTTRCISAAQAGASDRIIKLTGLNVPEATGTMALRFAVWFSLAPVDTCEAGLIDIPQARVYMPVLLVPSGGTGTGALNASIVSSLAIKVDVPSETEAGAPLRVQPEVLLLDADGALVRDMDVSVRVGAAVCRECHCPCATPRAGEVVHGESCRGVASLLSAEGLFGPGKAAACLQHRPWVDGNSVEVAAGTAQFSALRVLPAGDYRLVFSVEGTTGLAVTSQAMRVNPCVPRDIGLSNASENHMLHVFPEGVSDTGTSFCDGHDCIVEVRDAFGNLAIGRELRVFAELVEQQSVNVAGFSASTLCTCTGRSTVTDVGAVGKPSQAVGDYTLFDSSYGTYCAAWDTLRRDCAAAWPDCKPGWWCCRSWCYVDAACPGSRPDPLVPGLFYSYDACSEDPVALSTCDFKQQGNCSARDPSGAASMEPRADVLSGTTELVTSGGVAAFTDLSSIVPGRYALIFRARSGSQLLSSKEYVFAVTPLQPAKIQMAVEPGNSTTFGNPMAVQPAVALLDAFDNPVVNEWICPSVTASVVQGGAGGAQISGQKLGDLKEYCQVETFHTSGCVISAHAVDGRATFRYMRISGPPVDGLQILFTHGCCAQDPADCYCSSPQDPTRVDTARQTSRFAEEPCRVVSTLPFSLLPEIGGLRMVVQPLHTVAGGTITAALNLLTVSGELDVGPREEIGVSIASCDGSCSVVLQGTTISYTRNGRVDFDDMRIFNYQQRRSFVLRFTVMSHPEHTALSEPFDISAEVPFSMTLDSFAPYRTTGDNVWGILTIYDVYQNPAAVDGTYIDLSVVSLERAPFANTREGLSGAGSVKMLRSRAYFGLDPPGTTIPKNEVDRTKVVVEGSYVLRFESRSFGLSIERPVLVAVGLVSFNNVWFESVSLQTELIAWEPFYWKLRIVDDYGNFVSTASKDIITTLQLSSLPEVLKTDIIAGGCQVDSIEAGYAEVTRCRAAYNQPINAGSYPIQKVISMTAIALGNSLLSVSKKVSITAPVRELVVDYCVTQRICEEYFPDRLNNTCPCTTERPTLPQIINEPFFWFPRVRLLDSAGKLAERSTLPVTIQVFGSTCYKVLGESTMRAVGGVANFSAQGVGQQAGDICPPPKKDELIEFAITANFLDEGLTVVSVAQPKLPDPWAIQVAVGVQSTKLHSEMPVAIAGVPVATNVTVEFFTLQTYGLAAGIRVTRLFTTRRVKVSAQRLLADGTLEPAILGGTTLASVTNGLAVFSDLTIFTVGTYDLRFATEEYGAGLVQTYRGTKVRANAFAKLNVLRQPGDAPSSVSLSSQVRVELLDAFQNRLTCEYGECPVGPFGYPALVHERAWSLAPQSDLVVTARVERALPARAANASVESTCAALSADPDCACGPRVAFASRGVGVFECLTVGAAAPAYVLALSAGDMTVHTQSFSVRPGVLALLVIARQPGTLAVAGQALDPPQVLPLDKCHNQITADDQGTVITASVAPGRHSGLFGVLSAVPVRGVATFGALRFKRATEDEVGYTIVFSVGAIQAESAPVLVNNAPMEEIYVLEQPGDAVQGFPLTRQPAVRLIDRYGNEVTLDEADMVISATIVAGEGCPAGPCSAACDGTELRGVCFKRVQEPLPFAEARAACGAWGGALASVRTPEENELLRVLTQGETSWLGLQYSAFQRAWLWDDGATRIGDAPGSYSFVDWVPGLDANEAGDGACAAINAGPEGAEEPWGGGDCERALPYVCRKATSPVRTSCECCQELEGAAKVRAIAGLATFTDLRTFANPGDGLRLHFVAHRWNETVALRMSTAILSSPFNILPAPTRLAVITQPARGSAMQSLLVQPEVALHDPFGSVVLSIPLTVNATILRDAGDAAEGGTELLGTWSTQTRQGVARFTDLGLSHVSVNGAFQLRFAALVGTATFSRGVIYVDSVDFESRQRGATLVIVSPPQQTLFAGQLLSTTRIEMYDVDGALVDNSNARVEVRLLNVADDDAGSRGNDATLVGERSAICRNGRAEFRDLTIESVSPSFRLEFMLDSFGLQLSVRSSAFRVEPNAYTQIVISNQPEDRPAGESLPAIRVLFVDEFFNVDVFATGARAHIGVDDCCGKAEFEPSAVVTEGVATFPAFGVEAAGTHVLVVRFYGAEDGDAKFDACLEDPVFAARGTSLGVRTRVCTARRQERRVSEPFFVSPGPANGLEIVNFPALEQMAGRPFPSQPVVKVTDAFGNVVAGQEIVVAADMRNEAGEGCLCGDNGNGELCTQSRSAPTVAICNATGCDPRAASVPLPVAVTTDGFARFAGLACTRMSCSRGCKVCADNNCEISSAYRMSFKIVSASQPVVCDPCVAPLPVEARNLTLNPPIHVLPAPAEQAATVPPAVVVGGTPSGGATAAGFFIPQTWRYELSGDIYDMVVSQGSGAGSSIGGAGVPVPTPIRSSGDYPPHALAPLAPGLFITDVFGNINGTISGDASVALPLFDPDVPAMAGYQFCGDEHSVGGSICLGGTLTARVDSGFANFTDLFVRHPGPGYVLEFRFQGFVRRTPPFNVLPPPPRVEGVYFSRAFSNVLVVFDAPTSRGATGGATDCALVLSDETLALLGAGATCSWESDAVMAVLLGNDATLVPGDKVGIRPGSALSTTMHFQQVIQHKTGVVQFQRVFAAAPAGISLTSPQFEDPICKPVMIPEAVSELSVVPGETDVSASDIEYFDIDGVTHVIVANYCKGPNCKYDPAVMVSTAQYDIPSVLYRVDDSTGALTHVQDIPTSGAADVAAFTVQDTREDGPRGPKPFLVFANYYSDAVDRSRACFEAADPVTCSPPVVLYGWNFAPGAQRFEERQIIDDVAYASSVDVLEHAGKVYLVISSARGLGEVAVYLWVQGSFRVDERNGPLYKWDPGQTFGWVPAFFDDLVQKLPSTTAVDTHLFVADGDPRVMLAVANFRDGANTIVPVDLYTWDATACADRRIDGCFVRVMQLPAVGAMSVATFSTPTGPLGAPRHYVVVGNSFEGRGGATVPSNHEVNSYVYEVDLEAHTHALVQAVRTSSVQAVAVFEHCAQLGCGTYLAVANNRGLGGLSTASRVYRWAPNVDAGGDACPRAGAGSAAALPSGQFQRVLEVQTLAAQRLLYRRAGGRGLLVAVTASGLGVQARVLALDDLVPRPRPLVDMPTVYGACDQLAFDARSSLNSAGRPFEASWRALAYPAVPGGGGAPGVVPQLEDSAALTAAFTTPLTRCSPGSQQLCADPRYFPAGRYVLDLQLTNWIGGTGNVSVELTKLPGAAPRVEIRGERVRTVYAARETALAAAATRSSCAGSSRDALQFRWTVGPPLRGRAAGEVLSRGLELLVPKHALRIGQEHTAYFTAAQGGVEATASVRLRAVATPPVAKIAGGNHRVSLPESLAPGARHYLLDASASSLPDRRDGRLAFRWDCARFVKVGDDDVGVRPFPCAQVSDDPPSGATMRVDAARLLQQTLAFAPLLVDKHTWTSGCPPESALRCDPSAKFFFSVSVCDADAAGPAPCAAGAPGAGAATVEWSTAPLEAPEVWIAPLDAERVSASMLAVKLEGRAGPGSPALRWVQVEDGTPRVLDARNRLTESLAGPNLVFRPGVLVDAGAYTFRLYAAHDAAALDASDACTRCGFAEVTVRRNLAPSGGRLTVAPARGFAQDTIFTLSADQWVDPPLPRDDYPLSYSFGYKRPDGSVMYLAVGAPSAQLHTLLPTGDRARACALPAESECHPLELHVEVADALDAVGTLPAPVAVDVLAPEGNLLQSILAKRSQELSSLLVNRDGPALLTQTASLGELLNDPLLPWALNGLDAAYKAGVRAALMQFIRAATEELLAPLSLATVAHVLSAASAVAEVPEEVDSPTADAAMAVLQAAGAETLRRIAEGEDVARLPAIGAAYLRAMSPTLKAVANNAARRRALGGADADADASTDAAATVAAHGAVLGAQAARLRALSPLEAAAAGQRMVEGFSVSSRISVQNAGGVAGVAPAVEEGTDLMQVTYFVDAAALPGVAFGVTANSANLLKFGNPAMVGPSNFARLTLPALWTGPAHAAFEVQTALLYSNPLPAARTALRCIDEAGRTTWSSAPVLVPTDNQGGVALTVLRKGVPRLTTRACTLLGSATLLEVRAAGGAAITQDLPGGAAFRVRLPFNPTLQNEVLSDVTDAFSGVSSLVSCVYWDEAAQLWSTRGIAFERAYFGDAAGQGAYVECRTSHLSVFAASEVPADCDGSPMGPKRKDECGVCGGDNGTCAGCDGAPNSGRSRGCSGHGACAGDTCACEDGFLGVMCQVACSREVNCSGHGECWAEYEGYSVNTTVGCMCDPGWKMAENAPLRCIEDPPYAYRMPQWLFLLLVIGLPMLALLCCLVAVLYLNVFRQVKAIKRVGEETRAWQADYFRRNADVDVEAMEINVDLCMPIMAVPAYLEARPVVDNPTVTLPPWSRGEGEGGETTVLNFPVSLPVVAPAGRPPALLPPAAAPEDVPEATENLLVPMVPKDGWEEAGPNEVVLRTDSMPVRSPPPPLPPPAPAWVPSAQGAAPCAKGPGADLGARQAGANRLQTQEEMDRAASRAVAERELTRVPGGEDWRRAKARHGIALRLTHLSTSLAAGPRSAGPTESPSVRHHGPEENGSNVLRLGLGPAAPQGRAPGAEEQATVTP